mmetsp:Transcript_1899/g.5727  ORF Transcript_1899/g.5727 Transcript_1899/m.5727 type:complete len:329 (+) Transcript_1899:424-1410(+)
MIAKSAIHLRIDGCLSETMNSRDASVFVYAFEKRRRAYALRLRRKTTDDEVAVEPAIFELDESTSGLKGALATYRTDSTLALTFFGIDFFVETLTYEQRQDSKSFQLLHRTNLYPDCDFCRLREEPCECPRPLWQRRMEAVYESLPGTANVWSAMKFRVRSITGKAMMFNMCSKREVRSTIIMSDRRIDQDLINATANLTLSSVDKRLLVAPGIRAEGTLSQTRQRSDTNDNNSADSRRQDIQCPHCSAVFRRPYALRRHVNGVHLGQRSWQCEYCNASFAQRSHLFVHEKSMHFITEEHRCEICQSTFAWRANLLRHIRKFHSGGSN